MILPIRLYGDPVLRKHAEPVTRMDEELGIFIEDMVETMHNAQGIGLAAPQVGCSKRLFVVDISPTLEDVEEEVRGMIPVQPMVFINPDIIWESEDDEEYEEGCLSIPDIRESVVRPRAIRISYLDASIKSQVLEADDFLARVIQHEYDHLNGVLFMDHISAFRRQMLKRRLREVARGEVDADYPTELA